jgi:uncharacterized membrane protein
MEKMMHKTVADLAGRWLTRKPDALTDLEHRVLQSAIDRKAIAKNTAKAYKDRQSFGERLADSIARVGGSWTFILSFLLFLVVWTVANVYLLRTDAFDPYPFIFLNLVLSMLAAIQAPVIMMSQNRQTERDRIDATHDYEVNLKAEIEIMALHEKLDELRHQEMMAMRDKLSELTEMMQRLEARLAASDKAG